MGNMQLCVKSCPSLQAFSELQVKMIENSQRVKVAEGQIAALKRDITRSSLTDEELASLPPGTNTYQSVGRMYVLCPQTLTPTRECMYMQD